MSRKIICSTVVLLFLCILLSQCNRKHDDFQSLNGNIFGTYYSISYQHPKGIDLADDIKKVFQDFDQSLSTYNPNSLISRINNNEDTVVVDDYFVEMYSMAKRVSDDSHGAFDITVAPLVDAWGFGHGNHEHFVEPQIDSILAFVGYRMLSLENGFIHKLDPRIRLDVNAIAKGQSCDVIGKLLDAKGCENYMVEVGGEIVCKGINPKGELWRIGIDKALDDPANINKETQIILELSNVGVATSGNYRQFYIHDGKKYSHTIDPRMGKPVTHNLLSATVIAPSCLQADAYATAFMVLGVDSSLMLCNRFSDMDCFLIYSDEKNHIQTAYSMGFEKYISTKNK